MSDDERDPRGGFVGCDRCCGGGCPECFERAHERHEALEAAEQAERDAVRDERDELRATVERVREALALFENDSFATASQDDILCAVEAVLGTPGEGEVGGG